jgi:hypothetical protein
MSTIDIHDAVTSTLRQLPAALGPVQVNPVIGRAGVNCVKGNYYQLERSRPNELGGKRTHFWVQCAQGTHFQLLPDGVEIVVSQVGAAQRYYGGKIQAKPGGWLTIPARAEAHGVRAREFNNLRFVPLSPVKAMLVVNYSTKLRRMKDGGFSSGGLQGGGVMYWGVREVEQEADPSTLPTDLDLYAAIVSELNYYVDWKLTRG